MRMPLAIFCLIAACSTAFCGTADADVEVRVGSLLEIQPYPQAYIFRAEDGSKVGIACLKNIFFQTQLTVQILRPNEVPNENTIQGSMKVENMQACAEKIKPVVDGSLRLIKLSHPWKPDLFQNQYDQIDLAQ